MTLNFNFNTRFNDDIPEIEATEELPPRPSNKSVRKAGKFLKDNWYFRDDQLDMPKWQECIDIIQRYRQHHYNNSSIFKKLLFKKLHRLSFVNEDNRKFIVSDRLKRLVSIMNKLNRNGTHTMELAQMEDIAGVRVILHDMDELNRFINDDESCEIKDSFIKCIKATNRDYIENPKADDGYRSVHQIFIHKDTKLKLELQIRTQLQHQWATAVETYGSLSGVSIKTGDGDEKVRQFFRLCSMIFACREDTPLIPEFKALGMNKICLELKELENELQILKKLKNVEDLESEDQELSSNYGYYLLIQDIVNNKTIVHKFYQSQQDKAWTEYYENENKYRRDSSKNVVLVSIDNINKLREAYPNYFLDTKDFVQNIEIELTKYV